MPTGPAGGDRKFRTLKEDLKEIEKLGGAASLVFADLEARVEGINRQTEKTIDRLESQINIEKSLVKAKDNILTADLTGLNLAEKIARAKKMGRDRELETLTAQKANADSLRKQQKVAQGLSSEFKSGLGSVRQYTDMIPGIGGSIGSVLDGIGQAYDSGIVESFKKGGDENKRFTFGAKAGLLAIGGILANNVLKNMQALGVSFMDTFTRPEFLLFGSESRAIAEEFGNINEGSARLAGSMKLTAFFTGVSAENQAKILGMMSATSDASLVGLKAQMMTYKQAGVPFRAIMDDVAGNTDLFAKFAKDGGANIFDAAKRAKELGVSLSDVASISESLLNFESSIEAQMNAQVLLGRSINLDRARQLAFAGEQSAMMDEIVSQVGGEAEFNKLNVIQRKALADSVGLSVERMSALVREEQASTEASKKNFGFFMGIGAVVGGIVGLIASLKGVFTMGATTGKDIATMAKYTAGGIAAGGLAAGAGRAVIPEFRGLPMGRAANIRSGAAMAHAGESIVRTESISMDRTNELLERLVGETRNLGVSA